VVLPNEKPTLVGKWTNYKQETIALVSGASKGIGAGIAKGLAAAGASVAVNYASDRRGAEAVVAAITASSGRAIVVQGDVSKSADVARLFVEVKAAYGTLDVLVNNAAVYKLDPLEKMTEEEFHREFNTNVLGPLLMIREAVKYFGPSGGSIINIGSAASQLNPPNQSIYTATKSALDAITRVLAKELGSKMIRVNSINPGATATEGARPPFARRNWVAIREGGLSGLGKERGIGRIEKRKRDSSLAQDGFFTASNHPGIG
jgi:3-oxoacyl-[acyl-carrier protein] reductase